MAVKLSPLFNDAQLDSSGNPLVGGLILTETAGSSSAQATYQDSLGATPHTNPIVLNSRGEPPAPIWLTAGVAYKLTLKTAASVVIVSRDNISGVNDTTTTFDEWVSGPTPTFISATSFSVAGDQTTNFHKGRRVKTTNSGGTVYSTIVSSVFAAVTTVTVVNDGSSVLDSGLSAVSYSLLSASNPSIPFQFDPNQKWVAAGGTADAITAAYIPPITAATLKDGILLAFRATAANATTTPTFSPDGLTARAITKNGGFPLIVGEINNNTAEYWVRYNLANTRWELLNPTSITLSSAIPLFNYLGLASDSGRLKYARGHIAGLGITWSSSSALSVAAGSCRDSTDAQNIIQGSAISGNFASTWVAGNAQNKLDAGSPANSAPYHVYEIWKTSDGSADWIISASYPSPSLPSGYSLFRRIGSFRTDGAAGIYSFVQSGDIFVLTPNPPPTDISTTNLSAAGRTTFTLSVPTGFRVEAMISANSIDAGGNEMWFTTLDQTDNAVDANTGRVSLWGGAAGAAGQFRILTNTSGQIGARALTATGTCNLHASTYGWVDTRERYS